VDDAGRSLLRAAMQQLQMSARAYHRILKLARTIADPSMLSGQAWWGVKRSRRCTWRRRFSIDREGSLDRYSFSTGLVELGLPLAPGEREADQAPLVFRGFLTFMLVGRILLAEGGSGAEIWLR
jgi:hypothetical protein